LTWTYYLLIRRHNNNETTDGHDMTILKTNADNTLRITDWDGSFSIDCLFNGAWMSIEMADTRQAANVVFKSFGG